MPLRCSASLSPRNNEHMYLCRSWGCTYPMELHRIAIYNILLAKWTNGSNILLKMVLALPIQLTSFRFPHIIPQDRIDALPELLTRCLTQHQERIDQRRNFLHPDAAATASSSNIPSTPGPMALGSPLLLPHSR